MKKISCLSVTDFKEDNMEKNTNPWNDVKTTIKTNIDIPDSCMILTERQ